MTAQRKIWGPARFRITRTDGSAHEIVVKGRDRWALENLMTAGERGCTPIDHPGPRWSANVHALRHECQIEIDTITEPHDGPFSGHHARYCARSKIEPVCAATDEVAV